MPDSPIAQLERASAAAEALVAGIRPQQWSSPTPCPDMDVRQLVEHLVAGKLIFAHALTGDPTPPAAFAAETDLLLAYRDAAAALLAAFQRPGALNAHVTLPFGQAPATVALHVRVVEALVHGWDIAMATGQEPSLPQDLAEQEIEFSVGLLDRLPPGRVRFAPPQPVAADAPALDRLVAVLGRRPQALA